MSLLKLIVAFAVLCACAMTGPVSAQANYSFVIFDENDDNANNGNETTKSVTTEPTSSKIPATTTTSTMTTKTTATPAPGMPFSKRQTGFWNVTDSGVTCILLKMSACFNIKYNTIDKLTRVAKMCVPKNAALGQESSCANDTNVIQLTFANHSLTLDFGQGSGTKSYVSSGKLVYQLTPAIFKMAIDQNEFRQTNFSDTTFFEAKAYR